MRYEDTCNIYIYVDGRAHIYLCICLSKYLSTCLPVCLRACLSCVYSPHPPHLSRAPYVIYLLYPIDLIQSNPQSISIQSSSERYASATFQQIKVKLRLHQSSSCPATPVTDERGLEARSICCCSVHQLFCSIKKWLSMAFYWAIPLDFYWTNASHPACSLHAPPQALQRALGPELHARQGKLVWPLPPSLDID